MTPFSLQQENFGNGGSLVVCLGIMTAKLEAFIERLQSTHTEPDLQKLVENLRDIYDVNHAVYHAINGNGQQFAAFTYDQAWGLHYHKNKYENVDPVVRTAFRQFHPLDWKRLDWSSRQARALFSEAAGSGIGNQGYTVPIRGPNGQFAMFTINATTTDDKWGRFVGEFNRDMLLISHFLHQKTLSLIEPDSPEIKADLSPRERDALRLIASGRSRGQVAEKLSISEHTLRVYLDSARTKLRALNTIHAVSLAYKGGVITV